MRVFARSAIALVLLVASGSVAAGELQILTRDISVEEIPAPYNWGHVKAYNLDTRLDFHVDLDLLAPLGSGKENAATFFRDFAKSDGARVAELGGIVGVMYDDVGTGYPFDAPFVVESEQWIENGTMNFYPQIWTIEGWPETKIPNLLFFMKLGKTWLARGNRSETPEAALADYRRVVRLGRLVRQDDVTLIQDLIGIALIRLGSEAIYELARKQGDTKAMLIASLAIQDVVGIRNQTKYRLKDLLWGVEDEDAPILSFQRWFGAEVEEEEFVLANDIATMSGDRRLRLEGLGSLGYIMSSGQSKYAKKAKEALTSIASSDEDPLVRQVVQWYLTKDES